MATTTPAETRSDSAAQKASDKQKIRDAKAVAHPLRVRILKQLEKGKAMSPNMLSRKLDEPLGNVSYHVKTLLEFEAVKLTKTEPRRGAVEHYYKATGNVTSSDVKISKKKTKLAVEAIRHSLSETTAGRGGGVDQVGRTSDQRMELGELAKELAAA